MDRGTLGRDVSSARIDADSPAANGTVVDPDRRPIRRRRAIERARFPRDDS